MYVNQMAIIVSWIFSACQPAVVDIGQCLGACPFSAEFATEFPTKLSDFETTEVMMHHTCECCLGKIDTRKFPLQCDDGIHYVNIKYLHSCKCAQCIDEDILESLGHSQFDIYAGATTPSR